MVLVASGLFFEKKNNGKLSQGSYYEVTFAEGTY